jgi:pilus assembly protein CpaB
MARIKWLSALALGLLAAGFHFVYVSRIENRAKGGAEVAVVSVATDIRAGDKIDRENLATRTIPLSYIDDRTVRADRVEEIIDLVAAVDLEEGQLVQWTDFTARNGPKASDLADRIEPGQRAMTISVDRSLSMGGMLRPGHRVDILGTFSRGASRSDRSTVTLLQNVKVLATGNALVSVSGNAEDESESPSSRGLKFSTVTLSVGLQEAELLSLSSKQGTLSLALRGHQDLEVVNGVPEVAMKDIWERERQPSAPVKTSAPIKAIERIRKR